MEALPRASQRGPEGGRLMAAPGAEGLPLDLDGWPYLNLSPIGPWRVTPCCGAMAEYNNTGIGPDGLICKACYQALPESYVDAPPRLDPAAPPPTQRVWVVTLPDLLAGPEQPKEAERAARRSSPRSTSTPGGRVTQRPQPVPRGGNDHGSRDAHPARGASW
jgi:hypothetical protein